MQNEKALSAAVIGVMALELLPIYAVAADITQDSKNKSGEINVNYDLDTAYTVTIPASVNFTDSERTIDRPLQANGVRIEDGKALTITISSSNGFTMKHTKNSGSGIDYHLMVDQVTIPNENHCKVLTVNAGEDSGAATLSFVTELNKDNAIYAGNYTDTITFTVSVESQKQ